MTKFKVGDRVATNGGYSFDPGLGTVVSVSAQEDVYFVDVDGEEGPGFDPGWAYNRNHISAVAAAPAAATLAVRAGAYYKTRDGRKVGPIYRGWADNEHWPFEAESAPGMFYKNDGFSCPGHLHGHKDADDLIAEWVDEPAAPAPTTTVNLDLEFIPFPQVGDAVLIPGVISAINQCPRGTNYNIVFETQNRRMSLHFLEEDFILDECGDDDGDCPCANDNGPDPADTAKAFDALGDWLRAVAINPSAAFRSNKEAA